MIERRKDGNEGSMRHFHAQTSTEDANFTSLKTGRAGADVKQVIGDNRPIGQNVQRQICLRDANLSAHLHKRHIIQR